MRSEAKKTMTTILEPSKEDLELIDLKKRLAMLKPLGEDEASDSIKQLRISVLDTHADAEDTLEKLISKKLFVTANPRRQGKMTYKEFSKLVHGKILNGNSWVRKSVMALDLGIVSEDLFSNLRSLNSLRVVFAHPISKKYKIYEDSERQVWAYSLLCKVLEELAEEDSFFGIEEN